MAKNGKAIQGGGETYDTSTSRGPSRTTSAMGKARSATQGDGMALKVPKYGNNQSGGTALSRGNVGGGSALTKGNSMGSALAGATHSAGRKSLQKNAPSIIGGQRVSE